MCSSPTPRLLSPTRTKIRRLPLWRYRGGRRSICWSRRRMEVCREGNMSIKSVSRRDILKSLTMGAMASSVLRVIPAHAAEYAHHMVAAEKAATPAGSYAPKFFLPRQYKTLLALCQTIIPADADSGGALEAGAPEFIDLLTS